MFQNIEPLTGFGNVHQTEAIKGALPRQQNSPQQPAFGLYAEQLNSTAFTAARSHNLHSWLYRIQPSTTHQDFKPFHADSNCFSAPISSPNPMRWSPLPPNDSPHHFIEGLDKLAGNLGGAIYNYSSSQSMDTQFFQDNDGELLFVPQLGSIDLHTEFGLLSIEPGEIALIPRGVVFQLKHTATAVRGYLCENTGAPFELPELGPIGANGLAAARHFIYPQAAFEERSDAFTLICKYGDSLWMADIDHSPLNVVAWHGNVAPCKYNLALFNTIGSVSFDHPDPSIYTVLTSKSLHPGTANIDFVIFPQRWVVAEHTFRPPYFHRNVMSEFMGLIKGEYDAKAAGFIPGGFSIHNAMSAHGPDSDSFKQAITATLTPELYQNTLAFMFESHLPWQVSDYALHHPARQTDYRQCWQALPHRFNPNKETP